MNIASTSGHRGKAGAIAYQTAKAGVLNFTRGAAMELAPYDIRVNSVTPTQTVPPWEEVRLAAMTTFPRRSPGDGGGDLRTRPRRCCSSSRTLPTS